MPAPNLSDPIIRAERQLLQSMLQHPALFSSADLDAVEPEGFSAPAHRAIFDAVREVGPLEQGMSLPSWHARVDDATPLSVAPLVAELSVAPFPSSTTSPPGCRRRTTPAHCSCGCVRSPSGGASPTPCPRCGDWPPTRAMTPGRCVSCPCPCRPWSASGPRYERRSSESPLEAVAARPRGARPRRHRPARGRTCPRHGIDLG